MSDYEHNADSVEQSYKPPAWMAAALQLHGEVRGFGEPCDSGTPTDAFVVRCQQASKIALSLAKLRAQHERVGFIPLSPSDYVRGLARLASVALPPVFEWAGIDGSGCSDTAWASGFCRLARTIGIGLRQVLLHIRIGIAEQLEGAPVAVLLAHSRAEPTLGSQLELCEAVLQELERQYSQRDLANLRRMEAEAVRVYQSH
jgi:hypothetical protein